MNQEVGGLDVLLVDSPMKRGGAIGLRRVDVNALAQKRLHRRLVLALDRFHQAEIRRRGHPASDREAHDCEADQIRCDSHMCPGRRPQSQIVSSFSSPVLSWIFSSCKPSLRITVRCRFASGVSPG